MELPHYTGRPVEADESFHDGALRPAVGTHNFQVLRANRSHPEWSDGFGRTYNHAPMLCHWRGRFYLEYLSGPVHEHQAPCHTLLVHSADGRAWSRPEVIFPAFALADGALTVAHQRMGFYTANDGRLLALSFYGKLPAPNDGAGIGRAVREIREDGSHGPIYFIRYNPGYGPADTPYPPYTDSGAAGFVQACRELLANPLMVQQWWEEDRFADDGLYAVTDRDGFNPKAFCWYTLSDGRVVGLWKDHYFTVAERWEAGRVPRPQPVPTIVYGWAKGWGQRTSDGRYALVYNPHGRRPELRYPLAVTTGPDGLTFDQDLLAVHGDVNPPRFAGRYKDAGPQYIRGIEEGNGAPPDGALWLAYSVNKEDLWVSRVPVPVRASVDRHTRDDFRDGLPGGVVPGWNLYSPLWAPVEVIEDGGERFLRLRDRDPYDYAKAVRVFPDSRAVRLSFRIRCAQVGCDNLEIEVASRDGRRPVRLRLATDRGQLLSCGDDGEQVLATIGRGAWLRFELDVDTAAGAWDLSLDGQRIRERNPLAEKVGSVERLEFRTGAYRRDDLSRMPPFSGAYLETDLPDPDEPVEEAAFDIAGVESRPLR